jgi:hypothetical protein
MLKAAALGAAAFAGVARAADRTTDAVAAPLPSATDEMRVAAVPSNRAVYLQEEDKGRRPLMSVLDRTGAGQMMKDIGLDISGHVEVGYTYSFNDPGDDVLIGRAFDVQHDELLLNQADIAIQRTLEPTDDAVLGYKTKWNFGFKAEVMYGYDARGIHSNGLFDHYLDDKNRNEEWDVTQAYFTIGAPVGGGLLITAGKFVTPLGLEVINPTQNPLYSHSYLFTAAIPFTHTGVMAKYNFDENFFVYGGVHRGWEQSLEDNNDDAVSLLGGFGYTWTPSHGAPINFAVNATSGPEQANVQGNWRTVVDLIASTKVGDQLTLSANADYGIEDDAAPDGSQAQWYGVAVYAGYEISKMFTMNMRGEWFNDKDGARGLGTNVYEATLGVSIKPFPDNALGSNLVIRPEVRYDYAEEALFDSGTDHQQFTVGVDAIFAF